MSELKVYHHELRPDEYEEFYLKYQADKVIAEKDKEARHQKYKRCLAMAKWCRTSAEYERSLDAKPYQDYYERWYFRWLALADQFSNKEVK